MKSPTAGLALLAWVTACSSMASNEDMAREIDPVAHDIGPAKQTDTEGDRQGDGARAPLPAPPMVLSAADRARFRPLPARPGAVPVLLFHGICPASCSPEDIYGVSQLEFARMMMMLESAGFTPLSIADYDAHMRGAEVRLPIKPILVTFDDGRLDAYRGADAVLAALGARATQFVITAFPQGNAPSFMSWSEIAAAQASGRWDIQLHADAGHVRIRVEDTPAGGPVYGPFYSNLAYDPVTWPEGAHLEPFDSWKARAEGDISRGVSLLSARVPGYRPIAFALPYGDYGQYASNDPRIAPELRGFLKERFGCWFTQPSSNPDFSTPSKTHELWRYTIKSTSTADTLYDWLRARSSQATGQAPAQTPAQAPAQTPAQAAGHDEGGCCVARAPAPGFAAAGLLLAPAALLARRRDRHAG